MDLLRQKSRWCRLVLAALLAVLPAVQTAAAARPDIEAEIKAAFLFNFAKFVEWPPEAFPGASTPVTLCVLADDNLAGILDTLVQGETLNNRRLVVRRLREGPQPQDCHVLFLGSPEKGRAPEVIGPLRGAGVLTVGEGSDFLDHGGIIRLFVEQGRVRFDINVDAAEQGRLKLSSKLLRLARAVNPQRRGG